MTTSETDRVRATVTADRILGVVRESDGARLTEIADELDLSKSAVHRHVSTLTDLGYLARDGFEYRIGLKFAEFASHAREHVPIYDVATEELKRLARTTGQRTNMYVEENGRLFRVFASDESEGCDAGINATGSLYDTPQGKSILAFSDWEDVTERVDVDAIDADPASIRRELRRIRDRRMATGRDEDAGRKYVAAPIVRNDRPVAAIDVSVPEGQTSGMRLNEDIPGLLKSSAKTIERKLAAE